MKPETIKHQIYDKGYDLSMIAKVLGKSSSLVSKVLNGKARSLVVAQAIAKILEKDINQVFPNQYDTFRGRLPKNSDAYQEKQEELRRILSQD